MQRLLGALDARDRALLDRWMLADTASARRRRAWTVLTHVGGARVSIAMALLPVLLTWLLPTANPRVVAIGWDAALTLGLSHAIVQLLKRTAVRPRPAGAGDDAPDAFSFPSGHACAALAVAFTYAMHLPWLGAPAVALAVVVGYSRIALGVHFPGDVVVGQAIAVLTACVVVGPS